jgi:glycosyltransferase involved in cell wall biosynthesis
MEKAGIYLFTSDHKEGWGAVLNEAMNSGCATVACTDAGSTPCLIRHGENGTTYSRGDMDTLYEHVRYLLTNPREQSRMGQAAYQTMVNEWNAEVAARRLLTLSEHLVDGEAAPRLFEDGPCKNM